MFSRVAINFLNNTVVVLHGGTINTLNVLRFKHNSRFGVHALLYFARLSFGLQRPAKRIMYARHFTTKHRCKTRAWKATR